MAQMLLIMGESGTGKSTSMRNCDPATTAVVNPVGKPLPFKGKFTMLNSEVESRKICKFMKEQAAAGKKLLVVDDFQYILSVPYMNRIKENGWDKWNDFGANYFEIIEVCKELPDDVVVAYMTHTETLENGVTTIKLIGKLLREKITIEGLFTIVLRTGVNEGKYYFYTQNSGKDTVKSPMGMFPAYAIDNDLNYVADKIRNFYEVGEYKTDAEMGQADAQAASDLEKPDANGRRARVEKRPRPQQHHLPQQRMQHQRQAEPPARHMMKWWLKTIRKWLIIWQSVTRLLMRLLMGVKKSRLMKRVQQRILYRSRNLKHRQEEPARKERQQNSLNLFRTVQQILILNLSHWMQTHTSMFRLMIVDGVEVMKVISKEEFGEGVKRLAQADNPKPENPIDGAMNPPEKGRRTRRSAAQAQPDNADTTADETPAVDEQPTAEPAE